MRHRIFLVAVLFLATNAVAEEGGGAPAAGGKPSAEAKQNREYQDKTAKLKVLQGRIESDNKSILDLAHKKDQVKDSEQQKVIMDQMVAVVKSRNQAVDQHNLLKTELTYRFPNKGETLNRNYQTQTKKTLEEIAGSAGLDELLTRSKKMIDRKYAPFNPPKKTVVVAPGAPPPATAEAPEEEEKAKTLRLER